MRVINTEVHKQDIKERNPSIELIEGQKYTCVRIPLKYRFIKCGHEFTSSPRNIFTKVCEICLPIERSNEYIDNFKVDGVEILPNQFYINSKTKLYYMFTKCGHTCYIVPNSIQQGIRCNICSNNTKRNTEQYIAEVGKARPEIEVLPNQEYVNNSTSLFHKFKDCGHINKSTPANILWHKVGCKICKNLNTRISLPKDKEYGYLYVIKLSNSLEEYIKVGVTTREPIRRYREIELDSKYLVEELALFKNTPINVENVEKDIHNRYTKIIPLNKFSGYTECFSVENLTSILSDLERVFI